MTKQKRAAKLLAEITGACPYDTSRTDCKDIDGWQPAKGCKKSCGKKGRGDGLGSWKCWLEWIVG